MKKIVLASDHAGFERKSQIYTYLVDLGYDVVDMGPHEYNTEDDYPDFIKPLAISVAQESDSIGIIFGGSGQGEAIVANRVPRIRCAVFYGPQKAAASVDATGRMSDDAYEVVRLERLHNDANLLSIGVRFVTIDETKEAVQLFLETPFSEEERHVRRINKIDQ